MVDGKCPNGCDGKICKTDVVVGCTDGAKKCEGNKAYVCSGSSWGEGTACSSGCEGDVCKNEVVTGCTDGAKKCEDNKAFVCSDNSWGNGVACTYGCEGDVCKTEGITGCMNGAKKCEDNKAFVCSGNSWGNGVACTYGCEGGVCKTDASTGCTEGAQKCENSKIYVCVKDNWWRLDLCINGCDGDACSLLPNGKECVSGAKKCFPDENSLYAEDDAYVCVNGYWEKFAKCRAGCDDGVCKSFEGLECLENDTKCENDTYYTCSNNSWSVAENCPWGCQNGKCYKASSCMDGRMNGLEYYSYNTKSLIENWDVCTNGCNGTLCQMDDDPLCLDGREKCEDGRSFVCSGGHWEEREICKNGCSGNECRVNKNNACVNGERECSSNKYHSVCINGAWKSDMICYGSCSDDGCVLAGYNDLGIEKECVSGQKKCENNRYYICENGAWNEGTLCENGCENYQCKPAAGHECTEGAKKCMNDRSYTCVNGYWGEGTGCSLLGCDDETGFCRLEPRCLVKRGCTENDKLACNENALSICRDGYFRYLYMCENGCSEGACLNSNGSPVSGQSRCSNNTMRVKGMYYDEANTGYACPHGCDGNACRSNAAPECSKGEKKCENNKEYVCSNNVWFESRDCDSLGCDDSTNSCKDFDFNETCKDGDRKCELSQIYICSKGRWKVETECGSDGCSSKTLMCNPHVGDENKSVHTCVANRMSFYSVTAKIWGVDEECPNGCDPDSKNCRIIPCENGDVKCEDDIIYVCSEYKWNQKEHCQYGCHKNTNICNTREPLVCMPGERKCENSTSYICEATGGNAEWKIDELCVFSGCNNVTGKCNDNSNFEFGKTEQLTSMCIDGDDYLFFGGRRGWEHYNHDEFCDYVDNKADQREGALKCENGVQYKAIKAPVVSTCSYFPEEYYYWAKDRECYGECDGDHCKTCDPETFENMCDNNVIIRCDKDGNIVMEDCGAGVCYVDINGYAQCLIGKIDVFDPRTSYADKKENYAYSCKELYKSTKHMTVYAEGGWIKNEDGSYTYKLGDVKQCKSGYCNDDIGCVDEKIYDVCYGMPDSEVFDSYGVCSSEEEGRIADVESDYIDHEYTYQYFKCTCEYNDCVGLQCGYLSNVTKSNLPGYVPTNSFDMY